jgi:hypothetical protein
MSIALAQAMLKPAVDAGVFSPSRDRSEKLRRFLLKFRLTSFEKYDAPSWDESAFCYDDKRVAAVIAKANAGDNEAADLLKEVAIAQLPNLPPNLAEYVRDLLEQDRQPYRRGQPRKFLDRDICIYQTVEAMRQHGFRATRNPATEPDSGCSIVSAALKALGVRRMSEKNVMRIWLEVSSNIPVLANSR